MPRKRTSTRASSTQATIQSELASLPPLQRVEELDVELKLAAARHHLDDMLSMRFSANPPRYILKARVVGLLLATLTEAELADLSLSYRVPINQATAKSSRVTLPTTPTPATKGLFD